MNYEWYNLLVLSGELAEVVGHIEEQYRKDGITGGIWGDVSIYTDEFGHASIPDTVKNLLIQLKVSEPHNIGKLWSYLKTVDMDPFWMIELCKALNFDKQPYDATDEIIESIGLLNNLRNNEVNATDKISERIWYRLVQNEMLWKTCGRYRISNTSSMFRICDIDNFAIAFFHMINSGADVPRVFDVNTSVDSAWIKMYKFRAKSLYTVSCMLYTDIRSNDKDIRNATGMYSLISAATRHYKRPFAADRLEMPGMMGETQYHGWVSGDTKANYDDTPDCWLDYPDYLIYRNNEFEKVSYKIRKSACELYKEVQEILTSDSKALVFAHPMYYNDGKFWGFRK